MFLICGVGNFGKKYTNTRHNIGFMVIDSILERFNLSEKKGFHSLYTDTKIGEINKRVFLQKPQTYMNKSGVAVGELANFYKIPPEDIVVIQDDKDMDYGKLKIVTNSSSGGHNGIKSIENYLGTNSFLRVKLGIGGATENTSHYVLSGFNSSEKKSLPDFIELGREAVFSILENGSQKAMNMYNNKRII